MAGPPGTAAMPTTSTAPSTIRLEVARPSSGREERSPRPQSAMRRTRSGWRVAHAWPALRRAHEATSMIRNATASRPNTNRTSFTSCFNSA
eukprot:3530626-Prymnesium_polylepis.1